MKSIYILLVISLFSLSTQAQLNLDLKGTLSYSMELNDIWGYTDTAGNEYALVGATTGLSIVDISDPSTPVELFFISGPASTWRDVKTWNNKAYVTNEANGGLLVVDLINLPDTVTYYYHSVNDSLSSAHNIYIDENGYAYLFGYNDVDKYIQTNDRGALILNLNADTPRVAGVYKTFYVHDGYVRGDTMWVGHIYEGTLGAVDVSDKANPVLLATQETPSRFTHNCWLSVDGQTLYTTDERSNGYVAAFDVSDLENIEEIDRYQSSPGSFAIPHNTHVLNNYVITSYYTEGLTVLDATNPANLVEVGNYDTSPFIGDGFSGCWGVYPYFSSGLVIASDIEQGLFVFEPTYVRACYLEGQVTSSLTPSGLTGVRVEFIGNSDFIFSGSNGMYGTGVATPGTYDVRFFKAGCNTQIYTDISMTAGNVTTLNTDMDCLNVGVDEAGDNMLYLGVSQTVFQNSTSIQYINNTGYSDPAEISIFDIHGRLINQWTIDTPEATITTGSSLQSGVYLVTARINNETQTIKIIKG